jgi:hypothetical protein
MGMDKAIDSGKERRRSWDIFKGKKGCCPGLFHVHECNVCSVNRTHSNRVREMSAEEQYEEYQRPEWIRHDNELTWMFEMEESIH